jgi:uncharacterized protein (DUF58 family)
LSYLKKILIKTRRQIFSEIVGNNPSIFKGEGYDFTELREYEAGDDVRKIDWLISAKLQTPYIRIYKEERELNISIVALMGGSSYFGQKVLKQELMANIVSLLAFSAVKNQDNFSFFIYGEGLKKERIKATKNIGAVGKALELLLKSDPLGERVDYQNLQRVLLSSIKRRSILFLIGDFVGFEGDLKLLSKKFEVIAIIVRDRLEEDPPPLGNITLIDPSTFKEVSIDLNQKTISNYKEAIHRIDLKLYKSFRESGVAFVKIYSDEDPFVKLSKLFLRR